MTHALPATRSAFSAAGAPAAAAPVLALPARTLHVVPDLADPADTVLEDDGLHLDLAGRTATVDDRILQLTFLEFGLLAHLLGNPRRVFTRRQLMDAVWGYPDSGEGRTVDVHVARLRRKVGGRHRRRLSTVHRVGYKYLPAV
ncbi:winged helix-turn-helix domain-containing protein [Yinghuangia sp. YIM S09857]|uniref:winged helix-turn-helix domain-containing protein n=1 Tax=Yinghuangia sp. YIM S09857 TaxID=3436929 RepID=UPI003F52C686